MQTRILGSVAIAAGLFTTSCSMLDWSDDTLTKDHAQEIGESAYIYGYPLVTMEMTRRVMTNVAAPTDKMAPMGQFANLRSYPSPNDKEVTAPNADTLYSLAWLDLSTEPYVLSIPAAGDRYFLMPMLDGWTNVFEVPGQRTTGTGAQKYLITGPSWTGSVPAGVAHYESPTSLVWILGRTYCTGTQDDMKKVHAFQDELTLVPLSKYGMNYTPPRGAIDASIDMRTPVRNQVNALSAFEYFDMLASLLAKNPPAESDEDMVEDMKKLGIVAGQRFDERVLSAEVRDALNEVPKAAQAKIAAHMKDAGTMENGWVYPKETGIYGDDYLNRATITYFGLGANRPQDAVYPTSETDSSGKPYSGANNYVIRFPKGETPPVNGFWSITLYDPSMFFVANPLNRYTVSSRFDLKADADGSIPIYIQNASPGKEKESNWLPAPKGNFVLMMRLYWPKEEDPSILDGSWQPPAVETVSKAVSMN